MLVLVLVLVLVLGLCLVRVRVYRRTSVQLTTLRGPVGLPTASLCWYERPARISA